MKLHFKFLFFSLLLSASLAYADEYIVVSGGPALRKWERERNPTHDVYWGNFIKSAGIRLQQIQQEKGVDDLLTWVVYRPSYQRRSVEEGQDLMSQVEAKAQELGVRLIWFDETEILIRYLNEGQDRHEQPIRSLDFFGHSNKANWMFDYSNEIDACSVVFLHTRDLSQLKRGIFAKGAKTQSWGCHSGEYYSQKFRETTGVKMVGAIGKTDYSSGALPFLSSKNGKWTN
ncbi:MAG: hypothetical protein R3F23_04650 [Verrucomicrobiia bacterium]